LDRRQAYERDVLHTVAQMARGMSTRGAMADETRGLERMLRSRIARAVDEMRNAIGQVNQDSALVEISARAFEDFVADEILSEASWEEKLSYSTRGW
jgi:hypothetical protein